MPWQGASNEYLQHMFLWRTGVNYPRITTIHSSSLASVLSNSHQPACLTKAAVSGSLASSYGYFLSLFRKSALAPEIENNIQYCAR